MTCPIRLHLSVWAVCFFENPLYSRSAKQTIETRQAINHLPDQTIRQETQLGKQSQRKSASHPSICTDQLYPLNRQAFCSLLQHAGLESTRKRASKISIMCQSLVSTSEFV
jgi:hypothetical protein